MGKDREIHLLRKEIAFLDARWSRFQHDLRFVTVGRVTAMVNGLSSPSYSFWAYIRNRRERATDRLRELET